MKEFKKGKYYIYNNAEERTKEIATIHALIYVDDELYAIVSYPDGVKRATSLPVKKDENGLTVIYLGDGFYLNSDAPVRSKTMRFKVGKAYIDDSCNLFQVTNRYTDSMGETYIVLCNKFIGGVTEIELDGDIVEQACFFNYEKEASSKVMAKPIEELHCFM